MEMIDPAVVLRGGEDRSEGIDDFGAGSVVERESQNHARIAGSRLFSPSKSFLHRIRQLMNAANVRETDIVAVQPRNFLLQVLTQQPHEKINLGARTSLPVLCRERV